jgi:hypothetical protein
LAVAAAPAPAMTAVAVVAAVVAAAVAAIVVEVTLSVSVVVTLHFPSGCHSALKGVSGSGHVSVSGSPLAMVQLVKD